MKKRTKEWFENRVALERGESISAGKAETFDVYLLDFQHPSHKVTEIRQYATPDEQQAFFDGFNLIYRYVIDSPGRLYALKGEYLKNEEVFNSYFEPGESHPSFEEIQQYIEKYEKWLRGEPTSSA